MTRIHVNIAAFFLNIIFVFSMLTFGRGEVGQAAAGIAYEVGESKDFATAVLNDPWDMAEFSDVSQWINHAGSNLLLDLKVDNGQFSAHTATAYSEFFVLFPGYKPGLVMGKVGARHPIPSAEYNCLYIAMKSGWPGNVNNYFSAMWAPDWNVEEWADTSKVWGNAYGNKLSKSVWKLYKINLQNPENLQNKPWTHQSLWQTLRITPSLVQDTNFTVDWIRLTSCSQSVPVNLQNLPAGEHSLWIESVETGQEILVLESFSVSGNGSYTWDVQGIAPGVYTYRVKPVGGGGVIQQGQLTVNQAPVISFVKPSPFSGQDYASSVGNAWDMTSESDIIDSSCISIGFNAGVLNTVTLSPSQVDGCKGSGANEMDDKLYLNTPQNLDVRPYRYFSMRHKIDGAWSVPELGMVGRWIWRTAGEGCEYVTREIAYDVGWETYWVDLFDAWNGFPVQASASRCDKKHWTQENRTVFGFRFDPNENITGGSFYQSIDWMRLTKVDQAQQGTPFKVMLDLNKPVSQLTSLKIYYTSDLQNPTQHVVKQIFPSPPSVDGENLVFIPLANLKHAGDLELEADWSMLWDTLNVSPGEYYLCAVANDGLNQTVDCSEAPLQVVSSP